MFLGQGVVMEFDWIEAVTVPLDDLAMEKFPIREQKDRPVVNLGEATLEDDYSEDSFPHGFGMS
jgi:hypothetical protein